MAAASAIKLTTIHFWSVAIFIFIIIGGVYTDKSLRLGGEDDTFNGSAAKSMRWRAERKKNEKWCIFAIRKVLLFAELSLQPQKWQMGEWVCAPGWNVTWNVRIYFKYVNKMSMTLSALQCVRIVHSIIINLSGKNCMAFSILFSGHEVCVSPHYDGTWNRFIALIKHANVKYSPIKIVLFAETMNYDINRV